MRHLLLLGLILAAVIWKAYHARSFKAGGSKRRSKESKLTNLDLDPATLELLCAEDRKRIETTRVRSPKKNLHPSHFYQIMMDPLYTACNLTKKIGAGDGQFVEPNFVCLDDLLDGENECLVYSLSVGGGRGAFEQAMTDIGCSVFTYGKSDAPIAKSLGLMDTMRENGHAKKEITYLKVSLDGSERYLMDHWAKQGLFKTVKQIAVDMHSAVDNIQRYQSIVEQLHKAEHKIMSWEADYRVQPHPQMKLMPDFRVVFRRTETPCGIRY